MVSMERYLSSYIKEDLNKKIILLTGPRQVGKTTLSKLVNKSFDYYNYDSAADRLSLQEQSWDRSRQVIIFDELHKQKHWKSWLKGIYDTEGIPPALFVTGSAKLDTYRKVGDSLAGRFFQFRMHPFDLKELKQFMPDADPKEQLEKLLELGGFPEPFLAGTKRFYNRWKKTHLDIILRQDLPDLENVKQIKQIETLIELMKYRVGSPVSYSSLARDLHCSDKAVKKWLDILENMYVLFRVVPFHKNIARAIQKAPKYYFYDTGQIKGDQGARFENLVACALLKELHFREDCFGETGQLCYLRNKSGYEIDFCVTTEDRDYLIEVKYSDDKPSRNFEAFSKYFDHPRLLQITKEVSREKSFPNGVEIRAAHNWLPDFSFSSPPTSHIE